MCDQDGDGQIQFEEFAKMIFKHSGPPKVPKKPKTDALTKEEAAKILGTNEDDSDKQANKGLFV